MTTDSIAAARALIADAIDFACAANHHLAGQNPEQAQQWRDALATLADALEVERAKVAAAYEAAACVTVGMGPRYDGRSVHYHIPERVKGAIRALTPADAQAALDKMLAEARAMESTRADNLMRERDDALMRLGSLTEHLARLAEAKDHADGEPETDFDRGYDQAGDEIAAMIRDTEHNAQIIVGEMLAEARLEGWRAGRDAAADELEIQALLQALVADHPNVEDITRAIRALPEPKETSHV